MQPRLESEPVVFIESPMRQQLEALTLQSNGKFNPWPRQGDDEEPEFIESLLSQTVTRNGVQVRVDIYGDSQGGWTLEIVDAENTSHVWDEHFQTDQQALTEALRALDEEPLEFFGRAADRPLN